MENISSFTINGQMGQQCSLKYTPLCTNEKSFVLKQEEMKIEEDVDQS
jgi:hypothetical protein